MGCRIEEEDEDEPEGISSVAVRACVAANSTMVTSVQVARGRL